MKKFLNIVDNEIKLSSKIDLNQFIFLFVNVIILQITIYYFL